MKLYNSSAIPGQELVYFLLEHNERFDYNI